MAFKTKGSAEAEAKKSEVTSPNIWPTLVSGHSEANMHIHLKIQRSKRCRGKSSHHKTLGRVVALDSLLRRGAKTRHNMGLCQREH